MSRAFSVNGGIMAEPRNDDTPERYNETRDPRNPPNSVLQPAARKATTRSFLWPLIVLTVVAGLLWIFWAGQPPRARDANDSGVPTTVTGTSGEDAGKGGTNPDPTPDSTKDEIEFRGGKK
jgi:hypothetical protein